MQSLFPGSQGGRGRRAEAPLFSAKAGKCYLEPLNGDHFQVTPDVRKGEISIVKGSDNLRHV